MNERKSKSKRKWPLLLVTALLGGMLAPVAGGQSAKASSGEGEASVFTDFITTDGDKLMDGTKEFRFASLNYPGGMSDPAFSQEDALRTIAAIGGNVTRTYVPSVKRYDNSNAGSAFVLGPDEEGVMQFNEAGFVKLDNLLALANKFGVRVVIPFVDQWQWVGGIESYVNFRYPGTISGDAANDPDAWKFYTDPLVISDFKQVIHYMMNRVNTITGVKYKDDKAILAWETGNELGGYNQDKFPQAWTTEIADYVRNTENPSQLLLDGRFAVNNDSLEDPNVDIVGDHFYTGNFIDRINADSAAAADKKPYILGEFGLYTTGAPVEALYNAALKNGTDGIMIWSLRPHKDSGGFYWHDEDPGNWASYHWPGFSSGDYYGETDIIRTVYKYAHYMNENDVAMTSDVPAIPAPANAPMLFPITSVADIKWQGSVGASGYEVQRTENGEDWTTVTTDFSDGGRAGTPAFHDEQALSGVTYTYRVRGVNESGVSPWSNEVSTTAEHVIIDEMSLLQKDAQKRKTYVYDQSSNVQTSSSVGSEVGVGFKAYVSTSNPGYLIYASPVPMNKASVTFTGTGAIRWFASSSNGNYTEIQSFVNGSVSSVDQLPADTRFIKFVVPGSNTVQIDNIQMEYTYDGTGFQSVSPIQRNGYVIDHTFAGTTFSQTSNLVMKDEQPYMDNNKTLGRTDGSTGEVVYQVGGDMTSYRFTTYANSDSKLSFLASIDGDNYVPIHPVVSQTATSEGWNKVIYTDFALPASTRYLKAVYPATTDGESPAISQVEIGYGSNLIPLTDKAPANVFEDGEYDYGVDDKIKARYTANANGDSIGIALDTTNKNHGNYGVKVDYAFDSSYYAGLSRSLGDVDLSGFDSLHAWVKPDGSSNKLSFQLTMTDNRVYEAPLTLAGNAGRTVEIKLSEFVQPEWNVTAYGSKAIELSHVKEFAIYVSSGTNAAANSGVIYLDDIRMANASKLDNFEGYGGYNALINKAFSRNAGGGAFDLSLDTSHKSEGNYGLRIDYNYAGPGYAGGSFNPDFLNLNGYDGFTFWFQPDGSGNELAIQFTDASGKFWETKTVFKGSEPRLMYVPFDDFRFPSWYSSDTTARPDASVNITAVSFYIGGVDDSISTSGTIYIDDINGAKFMDELQASTVMISDAESEITSLPYTISGTATNATDVTIRAGKQVFYAPVGPNGEWSYTTSKLANGAVEIKASVELYNGTVMSSDTSTVNVNVPNNPYTEENGSGPVLTNYVLNGSFDEPVDPAAWPVLPTHWVHKDAEGNDVTNGIVKLESGSRTGAYKLVHWNNASYEVTSTEQITDLADGIYEARAWTKSKGGQQAAEMIVNEGQPSEQKVNIPTGESSWAYLKISGIEVRDGKVSIGFHSKDLGDHWIGVDDVELVKTGELPNVSVTGVTLNKNEISLNVGGTETLTVTVSPANATNKQVTWTSNNTAVATVDASGKVTAIGIGTANITAATTDGSKVASAVVTVTKTTTTNPTQPTTPVDPVDSVSVQNGHLTVQPANKDSDKVSIKINEKDILEALKQNNDKTVDIVVKPGAKAGSVTVDVPVKPLITAVQGIRMDTGLVTFTVSSSLLKERGQGASTLQVKASKVDDRTLSAEARKLLGGHAVYDIEVSLDGVKLKDMELGSIQVEMPYELGTNEDPDQVIVYYLNNDGQLEVIKNGKYNADTGKVQFSATHFSAYSAAYAKVSFVDLAHAAWATDSIQFLAARGVIQGVGGGHFEPNSNVTRAAFLKLLMEALELNDPAVTGTFSDVAHGAWYAEAVFSAQKLGIVNGKSDGSFGVNDLITREEMAVMIYRAAQLVKLDLAGDSEAKLFPDQNKVSSYASEAVQSIHQAGLIQGMGNGSFMPQGHATRAQAAQLIYNLFNKLNS
ncbi:S-layer homology domain-containing protein [Paenibacillus sp. YAF4_2]|uniref:S-layer homology domain-containing protein n=1 Tax=Paenibacillus sp. YAF4_2 TaxID=3233085 RepID=UPI003F9BCDD3